jgi:hypothetical protein
VSDAAIAGVHLEVALVADQTVQGGLDEHRHVGCFYVAEDLDVVGDVAGPAPGSPLDPAAAPVAGMVRQAPAPAAASLDQLGRGEFSLATGRPAGRGHTVVLAEISPAWLGNGWWRA